MNGLRRQAEHPGRVGAVLALVLSTLLAICTFATTDARAALGTATVVSDGSELLASASKVEMAENGLAVVYWNGQGGVPPATGILARFRAPSSADWLPIEAVTGSGGASLDFDMAIADDGRAIAAWATSAQKEIWASYRTAAGVWGTAFMVRDDAPDSLGRAVQVAIDATGNSVVAWRETTATPGTQTVFARYRSAMTGVWSGVDTVSDEDFFAGNGLDMEVDSNGSFIAAWQGSGLNSIDVATRTPGDGGTWTGPVTPDTSLPNHPSGPPKIATDGAGNAAIAWAKYVPNFDPPDDGEVLWVVERLSGGAWSDADVVSGGDVAVDTTGNPRPQLAYDGSGLLTAAWVNGEGTTDNEFLSARQTAPGVWALSETIDDDPGEIESISMDVDAAGNAIAAWRSISPANIYRVELSTQSSSGDWSGPSTQAESTPPSQSAEFPSVAAGGDGGAAASWNAQEVNNVAPTVTFARYSAPIPPPSTAPPALATTPALGTIRILPKKIFRKARVRGSKKKRKTAAKILFSLSEPADVTFTLALRIKGRVVGGKCVRATKRNARRRSCELVVPWGKPIVVGRLSGAASVPFTSRGLRNGNYYLTVNAVAPTGQVAVPKRVKLTIG